MLKLLLILVTICSRVYAKSGCTSTVAITTCSTETLKNWPLRLTEYKPYLEFDGSVQNLLPGMFKLLPALKTLRLSRNKISGPVQGEVFENLNNLENLHLNDNQITFVDNAFVHCSNLKKLDVSMNKIDQISGKTFQNLKQLEWLSLEFNFLKVLPHVNEMPNLQVLRLAFNQIETVKPNSFSGTSLEKVYLNDNAITRVDTGAFKNLANLSLVDFKANFISQLDIDDILSDARSLKWINLNINSFKCDKLSRYLKVLKRNNVEVASGNSKKINSEHGITCEA